MKSRTLATLSATINLAIGGIAQAQTPSPTVDGYITAAKVPAGTDWAGTLVRMCIPPPPGAGGPPDPRLTAFCRVHKIPLDYAGAQGSFTGLSLAR
jgi:hypothetical protein